MNSADSFVQLEAISKAAEFGDIRFRSGEKKAYQDMNTKNAEDMGIKYPVAIVDDPSDKVNTLLQVCSAWLFRKYCC